MKNNKFFFALTAILLIISSSLFAMSLNTVKAQSGVTQVGGTPSNTPGLPKLGPLPSGAQPNYTLGRLAFIAVSPDPIGINQDVLVNIWTTPGTHHAFYMPGYIVTIQKPDGTTETIGPLNSYLGDCTAWFTYTVSQVGTWRFKFEAAGVYVPAGSYIDRPGIAGSGNYTLSYSIYYLPTSTDWINLTVQQDMVASYPAAPLPTDYWSRPISVENREWWTIAGNFPWTGAYYYSGGRVLYSSNYKYTPYVQAPNSCHVLWRRQGAISGLIGGEAYIYSSSSGGGNPSIIYAGRCYQTITKTMWQLVNGTYRNLPTSVWECYDLQTGQIYWDLTDTTAPTNIVYEAPGSDVGSVAGSEASGTYSVSLVGISGGRLLKYNPYTGAVNLNISIAPLTAGTIFNNALVLSIQTINATANNYRLINWTMAGSSTTLAARINSNISWPRSAQGVTDYNAGIAYPSAGLNTLWPPEVESDTQVGAVGYQYVIGHRIQAVDLYTGKVLWEQISEDTLTGSSSSQTAVADRGKIAFSTDGRHFEAWDGRTGAHLWTSDLTAYPWGNFWAYNIASYDFNETSGAIIGCSYAGIYAIDWATGHILWHYSSSMPPFEDPYQTEPFFTGVLIADGKVYAYGGEHTPSEPITRYWHLHCINVTTGEGIWKVSGTMTPGGIANGYLVGSNSYDGYTYIFGKGRSQTTVQAPDTAVPQGTGILIHGSIMDMSPGDQGSYQNPTARLDSPSRPGMLPCVSANSMETLMEYVYMQHPIDGIYHNQTITGVPLVLTAVKDDGTVINIGTTITDGPSGSYSIAWTPPEQGKYKILATFAGDDSYGSSSATTGVLVGAAPTTVPTPTQSPQIIVPDYTITIIAGVSAILIAIVIVGAVLYRKH